MFLRHFPSNFLFDYLNITGSVEVQVIVRVLFSVCWSNWQVNRRLNDWSVLHGLATVRLFPRYIMHFLRNCFNHRRFTQSFSQYSLESLVGGGETVLRCELGCVSGDRVFHTRCVCSEIRHLAR